MSKSTVTFDLHALRECAPVIFGRASPIARTIAGSGQSEGSPAERVEHLLTPAFRARDKLAAMRQHHLPLVRVLIATHVLHGSEQTQWPMELHLILSDDKARKASLRSLATTRAGAGPDAHSLTRQGQQTILEAEQVYMEIREVATDGAWWSGECDAVTRAVRELAKARMEIAQEIAAKKAGLKAVVR